MWLYLAVLVVLYYLLRWYRERKVVSHLRDKFIFITGCDSGFGNQLARQLDLRGLRVLAACLTEQGVEQLRKQTSDRLQTVILDVTKTESVAVATEWVKERVGDRGLWGLVNKPGICTMTAPNQWLIKQDFVKILDVNLLGVIDMTLSLLTLGRKRRGYVANISSIMGQLALFGGGYCMFKYRVEPFLDSLRRELSYFEVKLAMVEPSYFLTNMIQGEVFNGTVQASWDHASPEIQELYDDNFLADYTPTALLNTFLVQRTTVNRRDLILFCLLLPILERLRGLRPSGGNSDSGVWGIMPAFALAPNEWLTKQDFVKVLDVNLLGVIDVTLSLLPLVQKARGHVVNVSSVLGQVSLHAGSYCISKYGVEAFSDSLSLITSQSIPPQPACVCPGKAMSLYLVVLIVLYCLLRWDQERQVARGRVVNVSSILGRVSIHGGGYCISKKGVEAFSDSLRRELSYFGVKVAMIEPGYFVTNMTQGEGSGYFQALWNQASPEVKELYGENFPADPVEHHPEAVENLNM
ncbi:hypothetical protein MJG53_004405 [Ovis ammon polii x Ovis aries]|uniref:Uncharacterized protein n=1 Tax=Ovis ammon polii x Ovis aries TaxID=2918886 RepID=A0ACB9VA55_9CETA|nr:hypothetical protein MJG53_004405 [Ovis ammon polii x Ovis aries]